MANKTPSADATIKRAKHSKENPYYLSLRETAQDAGISYQALGLLTHLLSLPDDWEVRVKTLVRKAKKNGRDFVYSAIKELCDAGYMTPRSKYRNERGHWVWGPYYVYESRLPEADRVPYPAQPVPPQPDTVQPDTAEAEIKTKETVTKYTHTEDVVVVPTPATESTAIPLKAELPQPTPLDELREGKDKEQALIEAGLKNTSNDTLNPPVPQHPLSPSAELLVTGLGKADVSRTVAVELVEAYGEGRVSAVWQYALKHRATIHTPVAFLRSELANPRYVPLNAAAPDETPAEGYTEIDEAEIETQADTTSVDASVHTLVNSKDTAAAKWALVANQLALKGSRAIKDAQLVAYNAATQTYTVQVASLEGQKQLSGRNARVVASTLTGLHAGSSVTFIVRESVQKGN
jgi:hypothetical protein